MPNTAPVQVPITVDNETAAGISQAVAGLKQLESAGSAAGEHVTGSFKEAKGAAALLGEETGVNLNRHLRTVLASSQLLGPILEAAFPIAAAVGFAEVLVDLGAKIYDFANGTKEAAEQTKTLAESLSKMANVRGQLLSQAQGARAEGALIGLTGQDRSNEEIRQLNELLLENQARIRQTSDNIYGLQNGLLTVGNGFKTAKEEVASLNGTLGDLQAREELLEQQLSNKTSQAFVDQREKEKEKAEKLTAALKQLNEEVSKLGPISFSGASIDRVFSAARGASSVAAPPTGTLADFGIKSPLFPVFATKEELDIAKQYGFVLTGITEQTKQLSTAQKDLDDALTHGFDNAFNDIALGTRSVGQAFESLASSVAASVLQMVAKLLILPPIISAINGLLSAVGLGSSFGAKGSVFVPGGKLSDIPLFGGGRASGGPVMPNSLYLVGEHGPEYLRTGSSSGFVSPMGGGGSVQVNVINQSSQPVSGKASTRFDVAGAVVSVVLQDLSGNGPIRQALKGNQ